MTDAAYIAFDPGETYGYCTFDENGIELSMGQFRFEESAQHLSRLIVPTLKLVICEDYKNHGWKQQKKWSRNQTSKEIGKIEMTCDLRGVKYVLQSNTVKSIGHRWAGRPEGAPSNHSISHQFDANAHGVYYLQSAGIRAAGIAIPEEDR